MLLWRCNSFAYDATPNFVDDSLNVFNPPSQPPTYSCKFCGNDAHYGYDCPPQKIPIYYDDDDDEESSILLRDIIIFELPLCIAITPVLSTKEPADSLIMEDEHLDTILATKLNEDIDYVEASPPDSERVSLEEVKDEILRVKLLNVNLLIAKIESLNDNPTPDRVLKSPSPFPIPDDILREKLLNIHLLIAKIESLNDNPTPDRVLKSPSPFPIPVEDSDSFFEKSDTSLSYSDNYLLEFETFSDHTEETSSGSASTYADNSLPEYDSFIFEIEPDQGELTSVVMEDILGEPHVDVPNVLPTYPTLYLDLNFTPSDDSLGSDLEVYFPSGTKNKIFDPGIFFENRPAFYNYNDDDDEDYTIAITPVLSTKEPVDSLIMEDEHLDTIPTTKSDKVIKSSVEDLVLILSESEGIPDNMCDVPFRDSSPPLDISKDQFEDFSDFNDDSTSIDDCYFSIDDIDYVEASPLDSELVSLEEVKDDILREKLLNIHLLMKNIH
nr:hypothetical protein [Tanacetum cinerariifolium]